MRATRLCGSEKDRMLATLAGRGIWLYGTGITVTPLPFYPGAHFFQIEDLDKLMYFVLLDNIEKGQYIPLYQIAAVHYINEMSCPVINVETVLHYARFFTDVMAIQWDGNFHILGPNDFVGGDVKPRELSLDGRTEGGRFLCSGLMKYYNAVHWFQMSVSPCGLVEVLDEGPVVQLPPPTVEPTLLLQ